MWEEYVKLTQEIGIPTKTTENVYETGKLIPVKWHEIRVNDKDFWFSSQHYQTLTWKHEWNPILISNVSIFFLPHRCMP